MGKIVVLDKEISSKIAAGEVIERPVSVIKELVENSIDAGATAITVEIKNGGISFMRVTDNGAGIDEEDTVVAFERHSTSKISTSEDLNKIFTLGFRGEALASIAAVSQVELITKTKNSITGTLVEINGGIVARKNEIGSPNGTTIIIKNLFYNTPARLKFLKKESTEAGLISDLIERLSLTHPEISFKLINNNQVVIFTPGTGDILTTILSVFGKEFAKGMIPVKFEDRGIKISGFIGRPEISRSNRNYQCVFINKRYIKSKIVSSAIDTAYKTMLTINKYPVTVLYIDLDPAQTDVNVHPTKMEVRFSDEELVYSTVYEGVSFALKNNVLIPQIELNTQEFKKEDIAKTEKYIEKIDNLYSNTQVAQNNNIVKEEPEKFIVLKDEIDRKPIMIQENLDLNKEKLLKDIQQQEIKISKSYKLIGQMFMTYVIVEMDDKMFIIDQHAAHERLKFNSLVHKYKNGESLSQVLMSPIVIDLTFNEFKKVEENLDLFKTVGYDIEQFGDNTYLIRSVPYMLGENYAKEFFVEMIDNLFNKKITSVLDLRDEMLYSMACKSAIKANKVLTQGEMLKLIDDVLGMEDAFTCPHGRPIIISISKYEIEKMFKRIQ